MKEIYLVHCGFYDSDISHGIFEFHTNYFVAATSFEEARMKVKEYPEFVLKKMHIDGLQRLQAVQGYRIQLSADPQLEGKTIVESNRHRDLAPKK